MGAVYDLTGRRVLVTGASSGIGRSIAEAVVQAGGAVAALARDGERLDALQRQLGPRLLPIACDVTDDEGLMAAGRTAAAQFGGLDCAVINAGVSDASLLSSGDPSHWRRVIETNLIGAMATIRAVLPHFPEDGARDVVVIGSISSTHAHPTWPAYASSKAGLAMATECLRLELAPRDIRVSLIEFAQVATEIRERSTVDPGVHQLSPLVVDPSLIRRMDPATIAEFVLFAVCQPQGVHLNHIVARPSGCIS